MNNKSINIFCLFAALVFTSCADKFEDEAIDYCSTGDYQNCKADDDAGDCIKEAGCKHPVVLSRDAYLGSFTGNAAIQNVDFSDGYVGRIDKGCRSLKSDAFGGDVDWIAVKAKPGTPLIVNAYRPSSSQTKPVLYLHNRAGGELIYSVPDDYGNVTMSFLAPDEQFYISVEDLENYDYAYKDKCDDGNLKGGDDYLYVLKISNTKLEFSNLGLVRSSASTKAKFTGAGQSHYYTVSIPLNANLGIKLKTTSSTKLEANPVLSPLSPKTRYEGGSDYSWIYAGEYFKSRTVTQNDYIRVFQDEIPNKYADCNTMECKYRLAVTDYSSAYNYEYELTVESISH